jgi:predicted DNA-binding transcriptional regulator AlpA
MKSAMYRRLTLLRLLMTQDFETLFGICDETVHNAVKRGELPPPVKMFGRNIWSVESIQQHLAQRLEAARVKAEQEQAQRDTKVNALYGGTRHGRRQ